MRLLLLPWTLVALAGCLDLDLSDELNWTAGWSPDGGAPTALPDGAPSGADGAPWYPDGGFDPDGDAASDDVTPPWLVGAGACAPGETAVEALCLSRSPWKAAVRLWASEPVLASLESSAGDRSEAEAPAAEHHLVVDLRAQAEVELTVSIVDVAGHQVSAGPYAVSPAPLVAPLVITEVLLDPLGPEPRQEFVEVLNLGDEPLSLDGWTLEDDGGAEVITTDVLIEPERRALLVASGWVPGDGGDPPPAPGARIVTLDGAIGSGGLRNDGEALRLLDASGRLVTHFPAPSRGAGPGVSFERLDPRAPDGDPANWAPSSAGTSTPGGPPP